MIFAIVKQLSSCKKSPEKIMCFDRIRTHDLRDTGAMLYRLSYDALLVVGKERVQFIPVV